MDFSYISPLRSSIINSSSSASASPRSSVNQSCVVISYAQPDTCCCQSLSNPPLCFDLSFWLTASFSNWATAFLKDYWDKTSGILGISLINVCHKVAWGHGSWAVLISVMATRGRCCSSFHHGPQDGLTLPATHTASILHGFISSASQGSGITAVFSYGFSQCSRED